VFRDGQSGEPLVIGARVRVLRDPEHGLGPWPGEPSGRIAAFPGGVAGSTLVDTRWGEERSWWVVFDEPQFDGEATGPYREGQVLERYLQLIF
jgi:hypothetical protein